tara:strand:- start:3181 stop:3411 length:231 start_codon:yes stop_codon:yes gene_type:complete
MKLDDAVVLGRDGAWREATLRLSPGSRTHWFVMLHDNDNKTYILAGNDDKAIASDDLNALALLVQSLGLKDFTVCL